MAKKIVVVGSINLDLVASIGRLPHVGETIAGKDFATFFGGKGANQAVCAARLGGDVALIGRTGDDLFGDQLRGSLEQAGVDIACVQPVAAPSGMAIIMVTEDRSNSIIVVPGANASLRAEDLAQHEQVLGEASIILAQLEIPIETVEALGAIAERLDVPFMLDPAPAQFLKRELLRTVTWLTPNETETLAILKHLDDGSSAALGSEQAIRRAARELLAAGVRNVALKLGGRGVYLDGHDVAGQFVPSFAVEVVDTTAAGDAFNGGFALALTQGMEPIAAAHFATAVAAISVTRAGAQVSMPTLAEVQAFLKDREGVTASLSLGLDNQPLPRPK